MAQTYLDFAGLQHYDQKLKASLANPTHSYTVAKSAAKNWYRIANANTSQIDTAKPLHVQFLVTAWNSGADTGYYMQWFVDCQVFGRNAGIRIFGNSGAPFSQIRVLYENTIADIDANDRPAIDLYLNYVLANAATNVKVEEIYNSGWTFVADGALAASAVPTGFESVAAVPSNSGIGRAANSTYADYAALQRSNITANATLADSTTYRGRVLNCTNAITLTLPSINSVWSWFIIKNFNAIGSGKNVTIHPSTTSVLIDGSNADIILAPGEYILLHSKEANSYTRLMDSRAYKGATASAAGREGLVPAPAIADKDKFLKGDGTWTSANTDISLNVVPESIQCSSELEPYSSEAIDYNGTLDFGAKIQLDGTYILGGEYLTQARQNDVNEIQSFPVTISSGSINNNSNISLEFHILQGSDDFWAIYTLEDSFANLIQAGSTGLPMTEDSTETYDGFKLLEPEGKSLYVSCTNNQNGTYTFYPFIRTVETIPEQINLVVEQPDGTTSNVDMSSLSGSNFNPVLNASSPRMYITNYEQSNAGSLEGNWHWLDPIKLSETNISYINSDVELSYGINYIESIEQYPIKVATFKINGPNYNYFQFDVAVYQPEDNTTFYGDDSEHCSIYYNNGTYSFGGYGTSYQFVYHEEADKGTLTECTSDQGYDEYCIPWYLEDENFTIKFKLLLTFKNTNDTFRQYDVYAYYYPKIFVQKPTLTFNYGDSEKTIFSGYLATKDDISKIKSYINNLIYIGATHTSYISTYGVPGLVPAASYDQTECFLRGDGTWATVSTAKEMAVRTAEPTASNTTALDNESIIFYDSGSAANAPQPVFTSGNQTIGGVKTFSAGIFSGKQVMSGTAMDCSAASCFTKTVTGSTTFSFTNVPSDAVCCVTLVLINGGNYTVNWPSSVKWTGNLPPELTANGTDVLTFLTCTGGNVWYGTTTCIGVTA